MKQVLIKGINLEGHVIEVVWYGQLMAGTAEKIVKLHIEGEPTREQYTETTVAPDFMKACAISKVAVEDYAEKILYNKEGRAMGMVDWSSLPETYIGQAVKSATIDKARSILETPK